MRNGLLIVGSIIVTFFLFIAIAGPYLPFVDTELEAKRLYFPERGKVEKAPFPPSERHPLGSTRDGKDVLSMLIMGARDTVFFVAGAALLRYIIAVPLGMLAYRNKGILSWVVKWLNQFFSSIPEILIGIIILNLPFLLYSDHRYIWAFFILSFIGVGKVSYIIQQQAHQISQKPFIETAITVGVKPLARLKNHFLPNLMPEIITNFCLDIGKIALLVGQLAILQIFLTQELVQMTQGLSEIVNASNDWASMMAGSRKDIRSAFWIPFYPALSLTLLIMSFTILGEGFRKYFNRHLD